MGFCYAFMMRIPGVLPVMVWASIFLTVGIVFAGAWYAGDTAKQWEAADPPKYTEDEIRVATIASYVLYVLGGLLVLLFLFMRKRIQLAMGCVKETSKAILKMPMIILFPVFQGLGFCLFMIAWTVYAVNLASMGEFSTEEYMVPGSSITISVSRISRLALLTIRLYFLAHMLPSFHCLQVRTFEFSDFVKQCGWYMLFCFFWSGQYILAMGEIVFAMAGEFVDVCIL